MPTLPQDPTIVPNATCTACGCLCDDITLHAEGNRIVAADRACPIGANWFLGDHDPIGLNPATIEGVPASFEVAMKRAIAILNRAKSPAILGLTRTTMEAQAAALSLADKLRATIDPAHSASAIPRVLTTQRVGFVSATLGEVKDRADVILFWGVDPMTTHPRHFERYSIDAKGRFLTQGRSLVVVDVEPSLTSARADFFLPLASESWHDALVSLRGLAKNVALPLGESPLIRLAEILKNARYGAFFFGANLGGTATIEAALKLVRDLNASSRFVALTLGNEGNSSGAEAVSTYQAGSPLAIDFQKGYPRYLPGEAATEARLINGEADAALIVADDPESFLSREALASLEKIPTVRIGPGATKGKATVAIATATYGIHTRGTVMRSDGISLPLRPALTSPLPSDQRVLEILLLGCDERAKGAS